MNQNLKLYALVAVILLAANGLNAQCDTATIYADTSNNQVCFDTLSNVLKCYTNNIPDHDDSYSSPFEVSASNEEYFMCAFPDTAEHFTPLYEEVETTVGCTDIYTFGVSINGIKYDPSSAEYFEDTSGANNINWHVEARYLFNGQFGNNGGHLNPFGEYHYHDVPADYFEDSLGITGSSHSPIVGYAADGFPIYYKYAYADPLDTSSAIVSLTSGFSLKSGTRPGNGFTAPSGAYTGLYYEDYEYNIDTLDSCNGRYGYTPDYPNGTYYYVLTDNYPYIPRCFKGSVLDHSFRVGPGASCPASTAATSCDTAANNVVSGCMDPFSCNYNPLATVSNGSCYYAEYLDTLTTIRCNHFFWHGQHYNTSGTYYDTINSGATCDSIAVLILTINNTTLSNSSVSSCPPYQWNGNTYNVSGTYVDTITNSVGCDSIMTLYLTIIDTIYSFDTLAGCDGVTSGSITYTTSGSYVINGQSANGCDSVANLEITIYNTESDTQFATSCDSYTWNGTNYTASGIYTDTSTNVNNCDSITVLDLTINSSFSGNQSVINCGPYTWNGNTYTHSGTYSDTFNTVHGCDSILTLHLTIGSDTQVITVASACLSYSWNGTTYTISGSYHDTLSSALGCDSINTLNLSILDTSSSLTTISACNSYSWNGSTYTSSGNYTYTTTNSVGCDSIATLNLTILSSSQSTDNVTACNQYLWNGNNYTTSGTYTFQTTNAQGCDSLATLHLTLNQSTSQSVNLTACDSMPWLGGMIYQSGTYVDTIPNAVGCDSIISLQATINQSGFSTESVQSCGPHFWRGELIFLSGTYYDTIPGSFGCDSVKELILQVTHPTNSTEDVSACESYTWLGELYTQTGTYHDTIPNNAGCDSNMTLNLEITTIDNEISVNGATIVAGDNTVNLFQWLNCSEGYLPIESETNSEFNAIENGLYAVELTKNGCVDTSDCAEIAGLSTVNIKDRLAWKIYPNPTSGTITIQSNGKVSSDIEVRSIDGRLLLKQACDSENCTLNIAQHPPAMYFIHINADGQHQMHKVIKD